ncbi:hypothetical protein AVEN_188742-1, partial [Araneus ventricosus]
IVWEVIPRENKMFAFYQSRSLHFPNQFSCFSLAALWSEMILKHGGTITTELGLSTLCGVSDGFTARHIKYAVEQVLEPNKFYNRPMS